MTNIDLNESLDIAHAAGLHERLSQLLNEDVVKLAAGDVQRVDGAGVQLLCAFCKELVGRGGKLEWLAVSDVLRAATKDLGLGKCLFIPE